MTERNCTLTPGETKAEGQYCIRNLTSLGFPLWERWCYSCREFFKGLIIQVIKPASPCPKVLRELGCSGARSGHLAVGRAGAERAALCSDHVLKTSCRHLAQPRADTWQIGAWCAAGELAATAVITSKAERQRQVFQETSIRNICWTTLLGVAAGPFKSSCKSLRFPCAGDASKPQKLPQKQWKNIKRNKIRTRGIE